MRTYTLDMAKHELHDRAIDMRKLGMSYSQIKSELRVSKSTLSLWLKDPPLSRERINELRGWSERRIERCRETKTKKRTQRLERVLKNAQQNIGVLSKREIFIAGFFLYWAEGAKTSQGSTYITNTDPAMIKFFILWLENLGVDRSRLHVRLHLYADMNIEKETQFWVTELEIPKESFRRPYIKSFSKNKRKNYKGRFGHGTCNLILHNRDMYELVLMGVTYLREKSNNGFSIP